MTIKSYSIPPSSANFVNGGKIPWQQGAQWDYGPVTIKIDLN